MPGVSSRLHQLFVIATLPLLGACGHVTPPSSDDMHRALSNELLEHIHDMYQLALEAHNMDDVVELSKLTYQLNIDTMGNCERVDSEEDIDMHWRCPVKGTFMINGTSHAFERDVDIYQDSIDKHWRV